jgi:RNA polymerase sigma-70 factor (ECF subfamily)
MADSNTPAKELETEEKMTRLREAMTGLSASQRMALSYKFHFDYSYRQIAEITGWSIPKIETLIHRAKKKLISRLNLQEKNIKTVNY